MMEALKERRALRRGVSDPGALRDPSGRSAEAVKAAGEIAAGAAGLGRGATAG